MAISNNVQNVKFLRNGSVFTPSADPVKTAREVAIAAMEGQKANLADGTAILGRYQESGETVKTLVGFAYISGETKTLTIFDVDGAGADVDAKIKAAIEALDAEITSSDGTNVQVKVTEADGKITAVNITTDNTVNSGDVDTAITTAISNLDYTGVITGTGVYVTNVTEADGVVAATTATLPTVAAISETGKPITAVSESLGAISATAGTINAEYVNIADSGSLITATTVEDALAEIAAEIDAMDKTASAEDGKVVTTISETDGVVSETKANVKDLKLGGYSKDTAATGDIASGDTINAALSKLENKAAAITIANADGSINVTTEASGTDINVNIKSGERVIKLDANGDGIYTDLDVVKITTGLPETVKERYELRDSSDVKIGESIDIPKDSHIVSINYITTGEHAQNLEYVYIDVSGNTQTTYVDMSELVLEAEFASGVTATDHVVHGVVDPTSESFLTVGADGFKISGVSGLVTNAIEALDATVGSQTVATGKHVAVEVAEADGVLTALTVTEDDIASAQGLADEITARGNADTELSNRLGANVTTASTASAQLSALSGTSADASGVTSVWGAKAYAKDYTDEKVAAVVDGLDADVSGNSTHVTVGVEEVNGKITAVTVSESNIANADDLTAEITARKAVDGQNGQTYAANTDKKYISGATSLNGADIALNDALASLDADVIKSVEVNGVALAETSNVVNVQISSVAASGTASSPITVNTNNSNGAVTLEIGYIDCGTY